jgi:hypothetical protein
MTACEAHGHTEAPDVGAGGCEQRGNGVRRGVGLICARASTGCMPWCGNCQHGQEGGRDDRVQRRAGQRDHPRQSRLSAKQ